MEQLFNPHLLGNLGSCKPLHPTWSPSHIHHKHRAWLCNADTVEELKSPLKGNYRFKRERFLPIKMSLEEPRTGISGWESWSHPREDCRELSPGWEWWAAVWSVSYALALRVGCGKPRVLGVIFFLAFISMGAFRLNAYVWMCVCVRTRAPSSSNIGYG